MILLALQGTCCKQQKREKTKIREQEKNKIVQIHNEKEKKRKNTGKICHVLDPMIPQDLKLKLNLVAKPKQPKKLWHRRFLVKTFNKLKRILLFNALSHLVSNILFTFLENVTSIECLSSTNLQSMPINSENIQFPTTVIHSPTTLSVSSLNVSEQNENRADCQSNVIKYVDKNANSVADSTIDYNKSLCEDRLVHLIDKLHIENEKVQIERQTSSTHNHISVAAVAPALLLANHISPPTLLNTEKSLNANVKPEVRFL